MSATGREINARLDLSVEELVPRAAAGDRGAIDELFERASPLLQHLARSYYFKGADSEDVLQEARVAFWTAIETFRPQLGSFLPFARLVVQCHLFSAIKQADRVKHRPLSQSLRFEHYAPNRTDDPGSMLSEAELFSDPVNIVVMREELEALNKYLVTALSTLEQNVLRMYLQGMSYGAIAENLGRSERSIDNALERIRPKLQGRFAQDVRDAG